MRINELEGRQMDKIEECKCEKMEYRRKIHSNGTVHFVKQCLNCGKVTSYIKAIDVPEDVKSLIQEVDDSIRVNYYRMIQINTEKERTEEQEAWRAKYNAYLQSDEWKEKRLKVLGRDGYFCQACLEARANIAHHLTYEHVFEEPLFDLVSVCEPCHDKIHNRDKNEN